MPGWLVGHLAPVIFAALAVLLLSGMPVAFALVACGLALAVVLVGALLAATTGVVAASVISMGLISLPIMLRYGYSRPMACGVITASSSLAQVVLYVALVVLAAIVRPRWLPALPLEARIFREASGRSGHRSLLLLALVSIAAGMALLRAYPAPLHAIGRTVPPPPDERVIVGLAGTVLSAFVLALLDRALRLRWHWRSRSAASRCGPAARRCCRRPGWRRS